MRYCLFWLAGLLLCVPGCFARPESSGPAEKGVTEGPARWIEELGSDDFRVREAAMRSLMDLEEEPAALRQALKSPDPELRRRVAQIVKAHIPKRAQRGLLKVHALAKEGQVDEMIQRLVLWNDWDKGKGRESVAGLIARLVEWEHYHFGKTRFWSRDFVAYDRNGYFLKKAMKEPVTVEELGEQYWGWQEVRRATFNEKKHFPWSLSSILIASGSIDIFMFGRGVILSGEDVHLDRAAQDAVIVCRGNLEARDLMNCLVIAGGTVKCSGAADSTIISGEPLRMPSGVYLSKCAILSEGVSSSPVKFFDPEDVGLTVWRTTRGKPVPNGAVFPDAHGNPMPGDEPWIKEIRQGTSFAAGLCAGDIIVALDTDKTPSKDAFRKVLRKKLAEGGPVIEFHVRRDGKELEIPISVRD